MKLMSFAFTVRAVRGQVKTVTRRANWYKNKHGRPLLTVGQLIQPVEKIMGLKPGEKIIRIGGAIQVVSIVREQLWCIETYGHYECDREGFPFMTPEQFIAMYIEHNGGDRFQVVTRIKFRYREPLN